MWLELQSKTTLFDFFPQLEYNGNIEMIFTRYYFYI